MLPKIVIFEQKFENKSYKKGNNNNNSNNGNIFTGEMKAFQNITESFSL